MQKVLKIKEEVDISPVDVYVSKTKAHENTVRLLCSLALSVLYLIFVRASFP